jgi:RNA polymerase sigma-70 factor, ECF subfamily
LETRLSTSWVQRYVDAWERRDVDAITALLVEDARFVMPPFPNWFSGREVVVEFIVATGTPSLRHIVTQANGQPAIGWYVGHPSEDAYRPTSIELLTLDGDRVREIVAFASPELFPSFGLHLRLETAT